MSFWFPRYSPDGTRLTHEESGKYQAQWLDNVREIWHNGVNLVIDGVVTTSPAGTTVAAGGGKWASWVAANPAVIYRNWDTPLIGYGSPAMNQDGEFACTDDFQAAVKNLVFRGGVVRRGAIAYPQLSRQLLVWSEGVRTFAYALSGIGGVQDITVATVEFRPIPIDTPDGGWVLTQTHTGVFARPVGSSFGYRIDNGGQAYYSDAVYVGGVIKVAFTDDRGNLTQLTWPLTAPRVDVSKPTTAPPPPPPPPPPTPEPPPVPTLQAPDEFAAVRAAKEARPDLLKSEDTYGDFLNYVIGLLGGRPWGRKLKNDGVTWNTDVLAYERTDKWIEYADVIIGDGSGNVGWGITGPFKPGDNGTWIAAPGVVDIPAPPGPGVPPAPPASTLIDFRGLTAVIAELRAANAALSARVKEVENSVEFLATEIAAHTPAGQIGGRISLRTENGHYLCAEGGGGGEVNATRDAVGGWETFTIEPR
jgi:hypothetical protein